MEQIRSEGFADLRKKAIEGPGYVSADLGSVTGPEPESNDQVGREIGPVGGKRGAGAIPPAGSRAGRAAADRRRALWSRWRDRRLPGKTGARPTFTSPTGAEAGSSATDSQESYSAGDIGKTFDPNAAALPSRPAKSDRSEPELATPTTTWHGAPLGQNQDSIEIDSNGSFHIVGLEPTADDPDGKVGKVTMAVIADDLLEVTVTVRWAGARGESQEVLRCRIANCGN